MRMTRNHFLYLVACLNSADLLYICSVQRLIVAIINKNRLGNSKGLVHVYMLIYVLPQNKLQGIVTML